MTWDHGGQNGRRGTPNLWNSDPRFLFCAITTGRGTSCGDLDVGALWAFYTATSTATGETELLAAIVTNTAKSKTDSDRWTITPH